MFLKLFRKYSKKKSNCRKGGKERKNTKEKKSVCACVCRRRVPGSEAPLLPSLFVYSGAAPPRAGKFFVISPSNEKRRKRKGAFTPSSLSSPLFPFRISSYYFFFCWLLLPPLVTYRRIIVVMIIYCIIFPRHFPLFRVPFKGRCLLSTPAFLREPEGKEGRNKAVKGRRWAGNERSQEEQTNPGRENINGIIFPWNFYFEKWRYTFQLWCELQ